MANMVLPTVNNAAPDANSVPAPVGSSPTNSAVPMIPAPEVLAGGGASATIGAAAAMPLGTAAAQQSAGGQGAGAVNVGNAAAPDPAPSISGEMGLAPAPIAGWQAADFTGAGQSDFWGPASNAAWSAALGVGDPAPDYSAAGNTPNTDTFIGDSSMGDTLWYYASAGNIDDSQIADSQSTTTGAEFGDQTPSAAESVVAGSGADAAGWFTA